LLVTACLLVAPGARAAKETFTPHHVARLRSISAVAVSPDGQHVAYLLSVPRDLGKEKDGQNWFELHVIDTRGRPRRSVAGAVTASAIRWTPDGQRVSFLAKREGDEHACLYALPLAGGEARRVLKHSTAIQGYSWAPDSKRVAFLAVEPDSKEKKDLKARGFTQEVYEEDDKPVRVWIATAGSTAAPRRLLLPGSASELHWSPAGAQLALALAPTALVDDQYMFRKVRVVDVKTGKVTAKLDNPGKLGQIAWGPDGKHVAAVVAGDTHDPKEGRLWVASAAGGAWKDVTPTFTGHVLHIAWEGPRAVRFIAASGVKSVLGLATLGTGSILRHVEAPVLRLFGTSRDGQVIALVADSPRHPPEVYLTGPHSIIRRLTDSNPWLKDMRFAEQEVVQHKARDGLELEGILVRPLDAKKGQRYPLVLSVHGGPESHVSDGWVTTYSLLGQVGAARGMAVFYPNYRGSTGRGVEFSKLGQKDAAGKEFDDLVDAVDHLIAAGLVDRNKVGITGGSYGGYATAWASTYYSKRFAAGVMSVGVSNQVSLVGTTDIPHEMHLVHNRKWLWEDWNYFLERSPVRHVEKCRTPLLILHGKSDPRVHPAQSLELYRHLKVRGQAPVRLVLYPGEGHGNRRAAARLDYHLRLLEWMEHFLKRGGKQAPPADIDPKLPPAPATGK
jgi:dipeptidyl aminopeptidase/acylaminoacyl peptidase